MHYLKRIHERLTHRSQGMANYGRHRNRLLPRAEALESRLLLNGDQNPYQPFDVNSDLFVSPIDALLVINRLNSGEPGTDPSEFEDVSGDAALSAIDALLVINHLNSPKPLLTAALINDSGQVPEDGFDLLTNEYDLRLRRHSGAEEVFIRINGGGEAPFIEITNLFTQDELVLTEAELDALAGAALGDGVHRIELDTPDAFDVIDFEISLDREVPELDGEVDVQFSPEEVKVQVFFAEPVGEIDFAKLEVFDRNQALPIVAATASPQSLQIVATPKATTESIVLNLENAIFDKAGNPLVQREVYQRAFPGDSVRLDRPEVVETSNLLMFAQIEGILGSAQERGFEDWLDVVSFDHSQFLQQSRSGKLTSQFEDLRFIARVDRSFPIVAKFINERKSVGKLKMAYLRRDHSVQPLLEFEFGKVRLTSQELIQSGGQTYQVVTATYEQVKVDYTSVRPDGSAGNVTGFSFDLPKGTSSIPRGSSEIKPDVVEAGSGFDIFAEFVGVLGGSEDQGFSNQLIVHSLDQSIFSPEAEGKSGVTTFEDLQLIAKLDRSFPKLAEKLALQEVISGVRISYVAGTSRRSTFLEYELKDVQLTAHSLIENTQDGELYQLINLSFREVKQIHTEINEDLSPGAKDEFVAELPKGTFTVPRSVAQPEILDVPFVQNVFAELDGIEGSVENKGLENWIELAFVGHTLFNPNIPDGKPVEQIEEMKLVAFMDRSAPQIAQAVNQGRLIPGLRIAFTRENLGERFLEYELKNVRLTSVKFVQSSGELLQVITASFGEIEVTHTDFGPDGAVGEKVGFNYKLESGTETVPSTAAIRTASVVQSFQFDVFAEIDGIDGSARDENFLDALEVYRVDQHLFQLGDGRGVTPVLTDLELIVGFDKSFPRLAEALAKGETFADVKISYVSLNANRPVFLEYNLSNVRVTQHSLIQNASDGGLLQAVDFAFDEIKLVHTSFSSDGSQGKSEFLAKLAPGVQTLARPSSVLDEQEIDLIGNADAFGRFDGIEGDVVRKGFEDWVEIVSFEQGIFEEDFGKDTKPQFEDVRIVARVDRSATRLAAMTHGGKLIPSLEVAFVPRNSDLGVFVEYDLKNIVIRSYELVQSSGELFQVMLASYDAIKVTHTQTNEDGSPGPKSVFSRTLEKDASTIGRGLSSTAVPLSSTPLDIFVEIEGVTGSATDDEFKNAIEVLAVDQAIFDPRFDALAKLPPVLGEIQLFTRLDRSFPEISNLLADGETIPTVILSFLNAEGDVFLEYKISGARIRSHRLIENSKGGDLMQVFQLDFEEIKVTQRTFEEGGASNEITVSLSKVS